MVLIAFFVLWVIMTLSTAGISICSFLDGYKAESGVMAIWFLMYVSIAVLLFSNIRGCI